MENRVRKLVCEKCASHSTPLTMLGASTLKKLYRNEHFVDNQKVSHNKYNKITKFHPKKLQLVKLNSRLSGTLTEKTEKMEVFLLAPYRQRSINNQPTRLSDIEHTNKNRMVSSMSPTAWARKEVRTRKILEEVST
ncbi:hypothetical protein P5673_022618 [Acropora cervicornis]|uniref:Uncharacterized protein n=1 Tax=Acropora cervicornis TaxID=6130 RepID=A0AAD9Q6M2_ACRCE|nr:hypothetical protein P5673_022618 [Acropora cervicornis]